jgi:hypothetical protein
MQAVAQQNFTLPKLIAFPKRMGAPSKARSQPNQPQPQPGYSPQKHGNLAQWVAPAITLIIGIVSVSFMVYFRKVDSATKTFDEHTNTLIDEKLNPAVEKINENFDKKLAPINQQLNTLIQQIGQLQGRFQQLDAGQKKISTRLTHQEALARMQDPARILATIRAEIQMARSNGKALRASDLNDYKNAVRAIPASAHEYWTTVAAIINYQSLINQMSGEAPDPFKVSRSCLGLTGGIRNIFVNLEFSRCVVDLDTQAFTNVTFKDSVIRYRGGQVALRNVAFFNCTFLLDLSSLKTLPEKPTLLFALLDSPDQKTIKVD